MSSAAARVFRGCSALLAQAKSSAAKTSATTTTTAAKSKAKPKQKAKSSSSSSSSASRTPTRPTGILKVSPISPVLGHFLGTPQISRTDAMKRIWAYVKTHNLQNPSDRREIFCDEKLKVIFDGKDKVGFLEITKLLSQHFVKTI